MSHLGQGAAVMPGSRPSTRGLRRLVLATLVLTVAWSVTFGPAASADDPPAGTTEVPLKTPHQGQSFDAGVWPDTGEACDGVDVPEGSVLWHLLMGPVDQDVVDATAVLHGPAGSDWDGVAPDAQQGANFDWTIVSTDTAVPASVHAHTDAPQFS